MQTANTTFIETDDTAVLDALQRKIIQATQAGLPLTEQPYHQVAEQLGISVESLIAQMQDMLEHGLIRRIGLVPNHYKLGFAGNGMSVWNVNDARVNELGMRVGALDFVSHCYQRPRFKPHWPYNLFAMVHGKDREEVRAKVERIAQLLGDNVLDHDVLFSTRILKKTGLRIA